MLEPDRRRGLKLKIIVKNKIIKNVREKTKTTSLFEISGESQIKFMKTGVLQVFDSYSIVKPLAYSRIIL